MKPGISVVIPEDPWKRGKRTEAIKSGELVYHETAQCWTCHPSYLSKKDILSLARLQKRTDEPKSFREIPFRDDMVYSRSLVSTYGKVILPDFLRDTLRSGQQKTDIFRTIAAGVGGTPMPSWYKKVSGQDIWALVHYVEELIRLKGTPQAEVIYQRVGQQLEIFPSKSMRQCEGAVF